MSGSYHEYGKFVKYLKVSNCNDVRTRRPSVTFDIHWLRW